MSTGKKLDQNLGNKDDVELVHGRSNTHKDSVSQPQAAVELALCSILQFNPWGSQLNST